MEMPRCERTGVHEKAFGVAALRSVHKPRRQCLRQQGQSAAGAEARVHLAVAEPIAVLLDDEDHGVAVAINHDVQQVCDANQEWRRAKGGQ